MKKGKEYFCGECESQTALNEELPNA